jgi:hypothetical protein
MNSGTLPSPTVRSVRWACRVALYGTFTVFALPPLRDLAGALPRAPVGLVGLCAMPFAVIGLGVAAGDLAGCYGRWKKLFQTLGVITLIGCVLAFSPIVLAIIFSLLDYAYDLVMAAWPLIVVCLLLGILIALITIARRL